MDVASDICTYLYNAAHDRNGENYITRFNEADVLIVQRHEEADSVLRGNAANYRKNMAWLRQTIGASRFSEDGEAWEVRRDISQKYFNRFDREKAFSIASHYGAVALDALVQLSACSDRLDDVILRKMTASVLVANFFDVEIDATDVDLGVIANLMELGSSYSFIPPGRTSQLYRDMIQLFPEVRRGVLRSLEYFRRDTTPRSPLLSEMLEADRKVEKRIVLEQELISFIAAGTETSAAAMGWICFLLAREQGLQRRLRELAQDFWSGDDRNWKGLSAIVPLARFVAEALRLYPTSPIVSRFSIAPDVLGDMEIPANQNVIISFIGVQHDRRYRADPWKIDIDLGQSSRTDGDRIAFSLGPRVCGGKQFAMLELIVLLSVFVANARFDLTSDEPPAFQWKTQLVARGGQPVRVTRLAN